MAKTSISVSIRHFFCARLWLNTHCPDPDHIAWSEEILQNALDHRMGGGRGGGAGVLGGGILLFTWTITIKNLKFWEMLYIEK